MKQNRLILLRFREIIRNPLLVAAQIYRLVLKFKKLKYSNIVN